MNAKSGKKPEVRPVVTTAQTKEAEVKPAETKAVSYTHLTLPTKA